MRTARRTATSPRTGTGGSSSAAPSKLGGDRTTGAQNKRPVARKLAAWTSCHQRECTPSSNTAGNMPCDQSDDRRQPTDDRMHEEAPDRSHEWPTDEACRNAAAGRAPGKSVQEWQGRCTDEDQRRRNRHQEHVLHHVDREQLVVKRRERRTDGDPQRRALRHEGSEPSNRDRARKIRVSETSRAPYNNATSTSASVAGTSNIA